MDAIGVARPSRVKLCCHSPARRCGLAGLADGALAVGAPAGVAAGF